MERASYSIPQRVLHWGTALLIFFNLIFTDGIEHWHHLVRRNQAIAPDDLANANIHAYFGLAILLLTVIRIGLRLMLAVPKSPETEPQLLQLAGKATHVSLYMVVLAMPLSGAAAFYFNLDWLGEIHADVLKVVLWLLLIAHVTAALIHQFYWKTNVMGRMTKGG